VDEGEFCKKIIVRSILSYFVVNTNRKYCYSSGKFLDFSEFEKCPRGEGLVLS
jgi:hypothetical protein